MDDLLGSPLRNHSKTPYVVACRVLLNDIEVMADIGALASERGLLQPLRIYVALAVAPPQVDALDQTFDYSNIYEFARRLATERTTLIETFALRLARSCLADERVFEVEVRVDKPQAIPGCLAGTCIKVRRG